MNLQPASWDIPLFRIQPLTQPTITKRTSSKLKTHLRALCSFALPSHAPFLLQNSPPPQNTLSALTTNPTKHEPPKLSFSQRQDGMTRFLALLVVSNKLAFLFPFSILRMDEASIRDSEPARTHSQASLVVERISVPPKAELAIVEWFVSAVS